MSFSRYGVALALALALMGCALGGLGLSPSASSSPQGRRETAEPRRPVALVLGEGGRQLIVAHRSGSASILDAEKRSVLSEKRIGQRLADLAALPEGRLLALDEAANELLVLSPKLDVQERVAVPMAPVSLAVRGDGSRVYVASLWGRQLAMVDRRVSPAKVAKTLSLPFAPRKILLIARESKLVVADAFGGRLAVVDVERGEVESVREVPAHQIGGLTLSADGKQLLVPHQTLSRLARTTRDDVHWGNLLANYIRVIPLKDLLNPESDLVAASQVLPLGDFGHGTADPTGLALTPSGVAIQALGGVGEVALGTLGDDRVRYLRVGRRPTQVVVTPDGLGVYVVNTLSDSLSYVDLKSRKSAIEIPLGEARALTAAERGEQLFHDSRLTHDGWFSCQSCHVDGHSNGLLADTLGDGTYGAPKRVPSLRGVKDSRPYAWNGSKKDLETQLRDTLRITMQGSEPIADQLSDLIAYLKTLEPPPPLLKGDATAIARGQALFVQKNCASCHQAPSYTTPKIYDVGLRDELGTKEFNPPSLRGVGQGGPYFHDGRAANLTEVFVKYRHRLDKDLTKEELEDLLTFLCSL